MSGEQVMAWSTLAVVVGSMSGAQKPGKTGGKVATCAGAGTLGMLLILGWDPSMEDFGDSALALIVSCAIPILSDLFTWARGRYHTSYGGWAASLVVAVILGNWGAGWLEPLLTGLPAGR